MKCDHPPRYRVPKGTAWICRICRALEANSRKARFAAQMLEHNLTHGKGCRSIAKAIEARTCPNR
jgi:predicted secreted Zn-dependent protease